MRYLLVVATLFSSLLVAADKPDFSGEWVMNAAKSDWGQIPPPSKFIRKIDHKDPNMAMNTTIASSQGEMSTDVKYTTDGKEATNSIRGTDVKGTMSWAGNDIQLVTKRQIPDGELVQKEDWKLSADGKTMDVTSKMTAPQGEMTLKLVLEKK